MKNIQLSPVAKTIILLLLILFPAITIGQNDNMNNFKEFVGSKTQDDEVLAKTKEVQLEKLEYEISLQKYYNESLINRKRAFQWSNLSSLIIFWMVIIIVFCGLIFSAVQFRISMLHAKDKLHKKNKISKPGEVLSGTTNATTEPTSPDEGDNETTKFKLSLSGLEVNSSVLGILILVISLAFFYLYLVYVYPVKEYNLENKAAIEEPVSLLQKDQK